MNIAYVSALAALAGSVVGGLISGLATWLAQQSQIQAGHVAHQVSHREDLFREFIVAASKAYGKAMMSEEPELQDLVEMYSAVNRMRVLCSPRTIASAEQVARATLETYLQPNKTVRDILEMMKSDAETNPLSEFDDAAREELRALLAR